MNNKGRTKRATSKALKSVLLTISVMPKEMLAIRVIQKTSHLTFSSLVRYLINEGLNSLMTLNTAEIVRTVLQHEAEREVMERHAKK